MTNKIMFLDLEVQNIPYYGAIASPRHPDNYVVLNGYVVEEVPYSGTVEVDHYLSKEAVPQQWLNIPSDVWLLVCHNAAFEMDWFLFQQLPQITAYLKRGGRIFCTAYAEYLLSHQLETYPTLDETAPKYGGTHKVDGIKILWDQGVKTADIDPVLLREYLAGPEGDVVNTRLTFYGQYAKLVAGGMLAMAFERMEGLVYNCFCMNAGLFVNRETAFRQRDEGEAKLKALHESFAVYRQHIPDYVSFNPGSDFHMSAWLFGGPIKYVGKTPWLNDDGTNKFEKGDFVTIIENGYKIQLNENGLIELQENPTAPIRTVTPDVYDFDTPLDKYKSGKNKGQVRITREDTEELKMKNADLQFVCGPLVDLSLMPVTLQKEFKKEFAGKRKLADESAVISTGKDCLDMLALRKEFEPHVIKVLEDLQTWAKIDKDMGTYYLREELDDDGKVVKQSGMLQYLTDHDIVHHGLNVSATITGRLSSTRPNFQNLPRGDTSDVKKMFTSRFGASGFIVEADYSAVEVVAQAAFSKDKNLTEALMNGIDMHCMRLSQQRKEAYDYVLLRCKDESHPDHPAYNIMRTAIKPKAFAYQYGATAFGIAFATGCTVEEAQLFIDTEKALFPEVEAWYDNVITPIVRANGTTHREQSDDGVWRMYKRGFWQSPGGTCYSFREYESNKKGEDGQWRKVMDYKPTQIRNYPIQGESGFFIQGISGKLIRWLLANDFFGGLVHVINTVHDALYLDCHWSVLDVVCAGVKEIMESLPQHFNTNFGYDLQVPFPAAVEFGRTMHEKISWHAGVLNEDRIRDRLGWARVVSSIPDTVTPEAMAA